MKSQLHNSRRMAAHYVGTGMTYFSVIIIISHPITIKFSIMPP